MDPGELIDGDGEGDGDDDGDGRGRDRPRRWGIVGERRVAPQREGGEERKVRMVRGRGRFPLEVPAA